MRVVSLVPSVTETLVAWGIEPIAVTRFCEQPGLRTVGGTKDPDIAGIVDLGPDLVVLDDEENRREDAEALRTAGLALHVTHVRGVGDVEKVLTSLAGAVGADFAAGTFADELAAPQPAIRRVFVPIWRRPWMTMSSDTYGSSVLGRLGLANVFSTSESRYPEVTPQQVDATAPDLVLLPSEPYPFSERHIAEASRWAPDVRVVDGRDLFWWGTRTPAALRRLAQVAGA
ncbi:MAG TPA: helical backbone metal receptor [Acidimicrobiales bacterium]